MKSVDVHPTAILDKSVELDTGVVIGPYSILKGKVQLGAGTRVESHVVIGSEHGQVTMGKNNRIYSGAMVGGPPQDLKYNNEPTRLEMGDGNQIREFVTINVGTATGGGVTSIGNQNLLMAYVHVAHDCHLGSHIAIANTTNFAGHVTVEDHVRVGGVCSFNQFITIGRYAFIAGDSAVNKDVMPFTIAQGKYAVSRATNSIGLERAGFSKEEIDNVYRAVRIVLKGNRTIEEALAEIETECAASDNIKHLVQFIKKSERGIAR
ncbi:MAG TPA: acyl-ACP--UDP-N-acetylglucosamine O-acyltransferase [Bdellovibrionales bacterium]|nr:acyl-ACP--UDP-N-acetylglucosamine O-acyltransferase [Bdellovibrionales bacterium]